VKRPALGSAANLLPVIIDSFLPLKRTEHVEGCDQPCACSCPQVDALCWEIDGRIHVHPIRYEQHFKKLERYS
jgi:hypothetical protein